MVNSALCVFHPKKRLKKRFNIIIKCNVWPWLYLSSKNNCCKRWFGDNWVQVNVDWEIEDNCPHFPIPSSGLALCIALELGEHISAPLTEGIAMRLASASTPVDAKWVKPWNVLVWLAFSSWALIILHEKLMPGRLLLQGLAAPPRPPVVWNRPAQLSPALSGKPANLHTCDHEMKCLLLLRAAEVRSGLLCNITAVRAD